MAFRSYRRTSAKAQWSRYLIVIAVKILIITLLLHRFAELYTPAALALFALGFIFIGFSILLAIWALVQIWQRGFFGISAVLFSFIGAITVFAGPAWFLPNFVSLPALNDITTDTSAPPSFEVLAEQRGVGANSIIYPRAKFAQQQEQAYPDIQPLILDRSTKEAYDLIKDAIDRMNWRVAAKQAPGKDGSAGWIEATDKTLVVGFVDDVVVRVSGDDSTARVDMRSSSRYGIHDMGQNAKRIRELFSEVKTSLAIGERALKLKEEIKRHQAQKLKAEEEKRRRKAQLAAEDARAYEKILQERQRAANPVFEATSEAFKKPKKPKRKWRLRRVGDDIDDWNNSIN